MNQTENKIAYIDPSDTTHVQIYDVDSQTIVNTYDLPQMNNISMMYGKGHYLWITNGTSSAYMDINDGTINSISRPIKISSDLNSMAFSRQEY